MVDRCHRACHRRRVPHLGGSRVIRLECDFCDHHIGRSGGNWFGLDHAKLDEDGELIQPEEEYQFHFCSYACIQKWAFEREFSTKPEGTTT